MLTESSYSADCRYIVSVERLAGSYGIGCQTLELAREKAQAARKCEDVFEVAILERLEKDGHFDTLFRRLETLAGPARLLPLFPDGTPRRERPSALAATVSGGARAAHASTP